MSERVVYETEGINLKQILRPIIQVHAYFRSKDREMCGLPGYPETDYLQAETEVIKAHTFMVKPPQNTNRYQET